MVLFCVYMRFLLPNDLAKRGKILESRLLTSQYLREVRRMINDHVFCTVLPEWARIGLLTTSLNQSVKLKPAVSDSIARLPFNTISTQTPRSKTHDDTCTFLIYSLPSQESMPTARFPGPSASNLVITSAT